MYFTYLFHITRCIYIIIMILIVNKKKDNTHKNDIDNTIKSLILMIMIIVFLKNFTYV